MIEEELFSKAIALPVVARAAYLDEACGDDESLRESLKELIAFHEKGAPLFDEG